MAKIVIEEIEFKRGPQYRLPLLKVGEPAVTTDSESLFYGAPSGNVEVAKKTDLNNKVTSTNIKSVRDNSNIFEYSLDGLNWKQVQSGGGSGTGTSPFALINDYGADPTGVADSLAAFNSALATGKPVSALPGTYKVSGTIVLPRKATLTLHTGVIIKPSGDFNIIQIKPESKVYGNGATLNASGLTNFTKAGVYANGQDRFSVANELTVVKDLNIQGRDHEGDGAGTTSTSYTGTGIHFYSGNNYTAGYQKEAYIAYVQVSNINISSVYRGIWLEREKTPVQGNPWITSCTFDQINMYGAMRSIDITTDNAFWNGGHLFTNLQLQANNYAERYVNCDGANNLFQGEFWDIEDYFETRNVPPFEFGTPSQENFLDGTQHYVPDKHYIDKNTNPMKPNHIRGLINPVNILPPKITNQVRNFIGDQDDILAGAFKAYTVTKLSSHAIVNGTLESPFVPNKGSFLGMNGVDGSNYAVIELDFGTTPISEMDMIGFIFRDGAEIPRYIKVERATTSGGSYSQIALITNNTQGFWYFSTWTSNTYKLKFTFGDSTDQTANRKIRIHRIFATSINMAGRSWLNAAEGGTIYGPVNMNKNKTTNFVLDSGTTANRPSSPVVGQVFYDTTLGKPIFCKVGGASPTWTDALGTTV